jgi:hypothetical protein
MYNIYVYECLYMYRECLGIPSQCFFSPKMSDSEEVQDAMQCILYRVQIAKSYRGAAGGGGSDAAAAGSGRDAMPQQLLFAGDGDSITVYSVADAGSLRRLGSHTVGAAVRGLCLAPNRHFLYVVTPEAALSFHVVGGGTCKLTPVGEPVELASPPCYVTTDRGGRHLLLASYAEPGHACVLAIGTHSSRRILVALSLVPGTHTQQHTDDWLLAGHAGADGAATGPPTCVLNTLRSNSHCAGTDPSNRFAFVPCVGERDLTLQP